MSAVTQRKHEWIATLMAEQREMVQQANAKSGKFSLYDPAVPAHATFQELNDYIWEIEQANAKLRAFLGLPLPFGRGR